MEFAEFTDFETFKKTFGGDHASKWEMFRKAGMTIEHLNKEGLTQLIYALHGKWPHNKHKSDLITGAKRAIQTKFYEQAHGVQPSQKLLARDEVFKNLLDLSDEQVDKGEKANKNPKSEKVEIMIETNDKNTQVKQQVKPESKPKEPKPVEKPELKPKQEKKPVLTQEQKTEFSKKIAAMSLEDLIKWATELGIPKEKTEKHKSKPIGLAKMSISNMIRAKMPV